MDFALTDEQETLVSAVQSVLKNHSELPPAARLKHHHHDAVLQRLLTESGFLNAGRELGALAAALVVIEAARVPAVTEVAASALVLPQLQGAEAAEGPVALIMGGELGKAHRNLTVARIALVDLGEDAAMLEVDPGNVTAVETILAYPYGRFNSAPDMASARRLAHQGARLRQWWRVALAAEFAGAAESAIRYTIQHVEQRHVFGRPVGAFQAVQHRLAQCHLAATGVRLLALRAAWSGLPEHADAAACYAQQHVKKLLVDLHQFTGGMGVTNEFLLHFWTYRLRALQSEAGGVVQSALGIARHRWMNGA
jgi:alkylation response protein AidB-like acyl-CoA dehydrogenase